MVVFGISSIGGAAALVNHGITWSSPVRIDKTGGMLTGVSCFSTKVCLTTDDKGNAFFYLDKRWSQHDWLNPLSLPPSPDCFAADRCVAVEGTDFESWNGTSWTKPARIDHTGGQLTGVSCFSGQMCLVTDTKGNALFYNGKKWSQHDWLNPQPLPPLSPDCYAADRCVAIEGTKFETWNGSSWTKPVVIDKSGGILAGVSCFSGTLCLTTDSKGNSLFYNGSKWTVHNWLNPKPLPPAPPPPDDCYAVNTCGAIDGGDFVSWSGTTWTRPIRVDARELTGLSCGIVVCVAVDVRGDVLVGS